MGESALKGQLRRGLEDLGGRTVERNHLVHLVHLPGGDILIRTVDGQS